MFKSALFAAAMLVAAGSANAAAVSMDDKVALQAAMFSYIDNQSIDGVIPHVRLDSGEIVDLVPTKAHPMVLKFGDDFVLCTDFRDPEGKFVNVDFYLKRREGTFAVFQTEINNRGPLENLMKKGVVEMAE